MTTSMTPKRVTIILLFVVSFFIIGWSAPALYGAYVPSDQIVEVDNFEPADATTADDSHRICFDRTVSNDVTAVFTTELFLVAEDGTRVEVSQSNSNQLLERGEQTIIVERELPSDLREGTYRYETIATVNLANGQVERDISFKSNRFEIHDKNKTIYQATDTCD